MIARFSAYGFFKNQRYFEPFAVLAYLDAGLSFTMIGALTTLRVVCVNLFEVPSGIGADILGRRRTMIVSLSAYVFSFALFGIGFYFAAKIRAESVSAALPTGILTLFFVSEFLMAIGEAFRSGTHKSMIFDWLRRNGRANEKTAVYGITRSWSKIGSALSGIGSVAILLITGEYYWLFWLSLAMTIACLVNVARYPKYLDFALDDAADANAVPAGVADRYRDWLKDFKTVILSRPMLALFGESMGYEGIVKFANSYVQPLLKAQALALPALLTVSEADRTAVLVGAIFAVVSILSAYASRKSDAFSKRLGSLDRASGRLWLIAFFSGLGAFAALYCRVWWAAIICFVIQLVFENIWRPIMMSRLDVAGKAKTDATTLSVESQMKSIFIAVASIPVGYTIDRLDGDLYPVGLLIAGVALMALLLRRRALFTR